MLNDLEEYDCHGLQPDLFSYVSREKTPAKNASCLAPKFTDVKIAIFACKELPCKFDLQPNRRATRRLFAPNGCDSIYVQICSPGSKEFYFAMNSIKMMHLLSCI